MKNLFVGGSSEIAIELSKVLKNSYNLGRKKFDFYKKNFILKNYSEKEVKKIFKKIKKYKFDNILIFNGIFNTSFLSNFKNTDFNKIINTNLKLPLMISKFCILEQIINKNGGIYFISSISADKPEVGNAIYSISKNALNFASKILHVEQKKRFLRFNTISLGLLNNKMGNNLIKKIPLIKKNKINILDNNKVLKRIKKTLYNRKINGKNIVIK